MHINWRKHWFFGFLNTILSTMELCFRMICIGRLGGYATLKNVFIVNLYIHPKFTNDMAGSLSDIQF